MRRVYEPVSADDGARVLVDRLWPRGLRKAAAHLDLWLKDVAPSPELRRWYGHEPDRFEEFARRYREELRAPAASAGLTRLQTLAARGHLTLLTATSSVELSQAAVLAAVLAEHRAC